MTPERSPIVGVWQLTAYDDRASESDPWGATFGANPTGRAEYHPAGFLSIHIASAPDTPTTAPYFAYFGTWVLRETAQTAAGTEVPPRARVTVRRWPFGTNAAASGVYSRLERERSTLSAGMA